jgi:hypothetical protein
MFYWKSKKSFYFQIQWWIIVHLYNVISYNWNKKHIFNIILCLNEEKELLEEIMDILLKVALTPYSFLSVAFAWNGNHFFPKGNNSNTTMSKLYKVGNWQMTFCVRSSFSFHKNNSVIHVQHTNDRDQIKTQSYNKICFTERARPFALVVSVYSGYSSYIHL